EPGRAATALYWRLHEGPGGTLAVRPLVSGRDYHALHHENPAFRFDAEVADGRVVWRPYPGLPAIVARANGAYAHQPDWYRNFLYTEERDRGLDCVEDLASPGIFRWDLARGGAVLVLAAEGHEPAEDLTAVRAAEEGRRRRFPSRLHRAADAYLVRRGSGKTIVAGYPAGTRYRIHVDGDGLLAAGEPGVQLTWMDAKVGDWVVTPRIGKPVEVQALWLNALRIGSELSERWAELYARARPAFAARFWDEARGHLADVVDVDHRPGTVDATFRPNQILAVGGLPFAVLEGERARRIVDAVEARLVTPLGLRSLAPGEPGYTPRYAGGP